MSFAVIKEAAQSVSESNGYLHGYPPWLIVVIGAVIAAVLLWIFAKLVKWTIWVVILVVLVGGLVVAGRMLLGG